MDREKLVQEATAAVCGPIIEDFHAGRLDGVEGKSGEERLRELIAHRQPQIAAWMREAQQPKRAARCCECGGQADTVMGGEDYCDAHARNHRLSLPMAIGVAA